MTKPICLMLALSLAAAPLSGCTAVYQFDKDQLDRLDGYEYRKKSVGQELMEGAGVRESADPLLVDEDGDDYEFDGEDPLVLFVGQGGGELREIEHRYRHISVTDEVFSGEPLGSGELVELPRADIDAAGVRRFSWGRTGLLSAGIAVGAFVGLAILGASLDSGGGGGSDFDD